MVITQRGVEGALAGGSSSKVKILNREAERHIEEVAQSAERVTQSQEGLTQAPGRTTQKFKCAEEVDVSESGGLEKAYEGRSLLS